MFELTVYSVPNLGKIVERCVDVYLDQPSPSTSRRLPVLLRRDHSQRLVLASSSLP